MNFESLNETLRQHETGYVIMVVSLGLVGNYASFGLFAFTKLKLNRVHLLLASLAIVDNCFLLMLLLSTMQFTRQHLIDKFDLACKLSVYFPFLFAFLSTWLIVLFSIERFLVVYFPLKRLQISNTKRINVRCIILMLLFALAFYSFGIWTTHLEEESSQSKNKFCQPIRSSFTLLKVMTMIDTVITMLLPFLIIITLNVLIIVKLRHNRTQYEDHRNSRFSSYYSTSSGSFLINQISQTNRRTNRNSDNIRLLLNDRQQQQKSRCLINNNTMTTMNKFRILSLTSSSLSRSPRHKQYSRTTRMLLVITTTFLLLNGPTAFVKSYFILADLISSTTSSSSLSSNDFNEFIERLTCYIYYLHYSMNFFLYVFNIRKFREYLIKHLHKGDSRTLRIQL